MSYSMSDKVWTVQYLSIFIHETHVLYTVIRFLWVSDKFGTCTDVSVNRTLVEDKMDRFKGECAHFSYKKCTIYIHDGASAKFSANSHEMDNSVVTRWTKYIHYV